MPSISEEGIRIAIDRGGTFCDFWARIPGRQDDLIFKLLSVCPEKYADAPTEGIRQILEKATGKSIAKGEPLDLASVESIRMGTTVATNALLERKGERTALLITKGFRDLLLIGNQARPRIFDLAVKKLGTLYETVAEVDERVTIEGFSEDPEPQPIDVSSDDGLVMGKTGEALRILKRPDLAAVRTDLQGLWDRGFRSLAVALMHSYAYPDHEIAIGDLACEMGFRVSLSSKLQSMIKLVSRAQSAVADAYLSPITDEYLDGFRRSFKGELRDPQSANKLLLSQSHGGLVKYTEFTGLRAILSGPAGGVIGYARTCYDAAEGTPVLGFDMGGTSTDVSRYGGALEHVFESNTAEVQIQTPQLDVNTVAAGGGSILFWSNGLFKVGPQSAGAFPGPACYGNGGPLTITDANCFLGRVLPDFFPQKLHMDKVKEEFAKLTQLVNSEKHGDDQLTPEQVAMGFIEVANATMARPIRTLSEGRGFDTAAHNLACFGGAGGQHAVAIARDLGIRRILIHKLSSILSAYGMALADIVVEKQDPEAAIYGAEASDRIQERFQAMAEEATKDLDSQGIPPQKVTHEYFLNMRYRGSDTALMIQQPHDGDFSRAFGDRHQREFGFGQPDRDVLVDDIRVRSIGKAIDVPTCSPFEDLEEAMRFSVLEASAAKGTRKVYFETTGWTNVAVFHIDSIPKKVKIMGPAVAIDATQTIIIEEDSVAIVLDDHIVLDIVTAKQKTVGIDEVDPVQLSVFGHRFMSIAEQMGRTLQKTSISTNIKERLDYSCAIFSQSGGLVANAPHIPGHLGSMSTAIRYQADRYGPKGLQPGDVILSNHPCSGGTHLPDLTVTTPVFDDNENPTEVLFFVANRGHHADIGGILAGSMPPNSTELWQEGAAIESFKMVKAGVFDEEGLVDELYTKPGKYPGCSGTRTLKDNIADLRASVAANNRGIHLIQALVKEYSWPVVKFYMDAIQKNAEEAVRTLLKGFSERFRGHPLKAVDYMDDGTPLALKVTINGEDGSAKFDFTGTGPEAFNNLTSEAFRPLADNDLSQNTPSAVMYSGIIYCLRCMISSDIPLNQGCLTPIEVYCPPKTLLSPSLEAATVGSNVETSQRIVDLIFKAFRACAASQGTCNNLTFGYGGTDPETGNIVKGFGYYETIAGGAGAGPGWNGQSGVHTNITNTRITDPETFEKRYPVILREFSIRIETGGAGFYRGGDGCVRDIELTRPMQVSILSERRVIPPYGMAGGCDGARGRNIWVRKDIKNGSERYISLGGRATTMMNPGDRIIVQTPGGGGYGKDPNAEEEFVPPEELEMLKRSKIATNGLANGPSAFRANGSVAEREAAVEMGGLGHSTSVFSSIKAIPYDEAYQVAAAFAADKTPTKVDLGAGVYKDENGLPWTLQSVKEAISRLPDDHTYLPQSGFPPFLTGARSLMFGDLSNDQDARLSSIQTASGSHACHVGAAFLIKNGLKPNNVFISNPSWMNHALIWECADSTVTQKLYPYYHAATRSLDFEGMIASLERDSQPGDVVILQACAHNPTGLDPNKEQWVAIAGICERKKLFPFFDSAYQGFASGNFDDDAWAIRYFASRPSMEMAVAQSFSKNFGLYGERVGALHILASEPGIKPAVQSQLVRVLRSEISSGTAFGSRVAAMVLDDSELKTRFLEENEKMSSRIKTMRAALVAELERLGTPGDWSHITNQIGMFSYTGLTAQQVQELRQKHHIYLFSNGRASISGLNSINVARVAAAINSVVLGLYEFRSMAEIIY